MKRLFIAAACALCTGPAAAGDVTVSVANGTDKTFESVTVYAIEAGEVRDDALGTVAKPLRPGRSVAIPLSLDSCAPVFVQALYGAKGIVTTEADACDKAIFTLSE